MYYIQYTLYHIQYTLYYNIGATIQAELVRRDYTANGGWETFLSYEDPEQDILIGLLRLRKCSEDTFRPELKGGCSVVRELHVYGTAVPIHSKDPTKFQHQVCICTLYHVYL